MHKYLRRVCIRFRRIIYVTFYLLRPLCYHVEKYPILILYPGKSTKSSDLKVFKILLDFPLALLDHFLIYFQAVAFFIEKDRLKSLLEPLEATAALIAAAAHDINHPGKSSAFLCNSRDPLAILYNDICVLESHHAALTFHLTLSEYYSRT